MMEITELRRLFRLDCFLCGNVDKKIKQVNSAPHSNSTLSATHRRITTHRNSDTEIICVCMFAGCLLDCPSSKFVVVFSISVVIITIVRNSLTCRAYLRCIPH